MEKLAEILHELVDAAEHAFTPNRRAELHALADDIAAVLPAGPEKLAAEAVAGVTEVTAPETPAESDGAPAA